MTKFESTLCHQIVRRAEGVEQKTPSVLRNAQRSATRSLPNFPMANETCAGRHDNEEAAVSRLSPKIGPIMLGRNSRLHLGSCSQGKRREKARTGLKVGRVGSGGVTHHMTCVRLLCSHAHTHIQSHSVT